MRYSLKSLGLLLMEKLADAELEAQESHAASRNSYGAGFDRGFADAIIEILAEIPDEEFTK